MRGDHANLGNVLEVANRHRLIVRLNVGSIDQNVFNVTNLGATRTAQSEADTNATLNHIGVFGQLDGGLVAIVVYDGQLSVVVNLALGLGVLLVAAVPVEVVVINVQNHTRQRRNLAEVVQLEA